MRPPDRQVTAEEGHVINECQHKNGIRLQRPQLTLMRQSDSVTRHSCRPATTILKNGRVLIAGAINEDGDVLRTAEIYELLTERFHDTGDMFFARLSADSDLLHDGKVLITNGVNHHLYGKGNVFPQSITGVTQQEIYDPINGTFNVR